MEAARGVPLTFNMHVLASETELYKCIFLYTVAFVYFIICNVKPTHIPNTFWVHSCFQQNEHGMLHTYTVHL